ncbi:MAG TPA: cupin domain-containing protein, partial [Micromonosporaceae bacterium]|nr:cupin domain-containing protein [Micromonosporaceae bacterium]
MGTSGRVFVRGLASQAYGLAELRRRQLAVDRVRDDSIVVDDAKVAHSGDSAKSRTWWRIGPGDEDFLTQTIQVHFVELPPESSNHGHGHQNEAAFYILEGRGYEIHDDQRYDWSRDDLVFVHTDSVHRHFNPYPERALALVVKAKCTWMFLGLIQQGRSGPVEDEERFGPREDWSRIWTPGVLERKKVISPSDTSWEDTPLGRIRVMSSPQRTDARIFS